MVLISIVIPVYNSEKYISRCLTSILHQSFQNFEVIVVDDCSKDNSLSIVSSFSDNRVRIINNKTNLGTAMSRKNGYMNAKGQYLMFCDSDDWFPNNALEVLYKAITDSKGDIVIGNYDICSKEGKLIETYNNTFTYGFDKYSIYKSLLKREIAHSLCGRIFRTYLFQCEDNGEFVHFTNSEDGFVFYQVFARTEKISFVNQSVYCYYTNTESSSRVVLKKSALDNMAFFNSKLKSFIPKDYILDELVDEYISYSVYRYMLNGSRNFYSTFISLQKYKLLHYLNPFYRCRSLHHFFENVKIIIKSILFNY